MSNPTATRPGGGGYKTYVLEINTERANVNDVRRDLLRLTNKHKGTAVVAAGQSDHSLRPRTRVVNKRREPFDVYIGRPGPWGNPFVLGRDGDRDTVLAKYRAWLAEHPELIDRAKHELRGKALGCFCKPLACHGDVLVEAIHADD